MRSSVRRKVPGGITGSTACSGSGRVRHSVARPASILRRHLASASGHVKGDDCLSRKGTPDLCGILKACVMKIVTRKAMER